MKVLRAAVFMLLIINAGFDFGNWIRKEGAKGQAVKEAEAAGYLNAKANNCYDVDGAGWVCDLTVQTEGGETIRSFHALGDK